MNKLPPRPSHCTRSRMKPYIDSCECEWCIAINRQWVESQAEECNHPALYESCPDEGQGATWYCPDCESVIDA